MIFSFVFHDLICSGAFVLDVFSRVFYSFQVTDPLLVLSMASQMVLLGLLRAGDGAEADPKRSSDPEKGGGSFVVVVVVVVFLYSEKVF